MRWWDINGDFNTSTTSALVALTRLLLPCKYWYSISFRIHLSLKHINKMQYNVFTCQHKGLISVYYIGFNLTIKSNYLLVKTFFQAPYLCTPQADSGFSGSLRQGAWDRAILPTSTVCSINSQPWERYRVSDAFESCGNKTIWMGLLTLSKSPDCFWVFLIPFKDSAAC